MTISALLKDYQKLKIANDKKEGANALGFDSVFQWFQFHLGQIQVVRYFARLHFIKVIRRFFRFRWLRKFSSRAFLPRAILSFLGFKDEASQASESERSMQQRFGFEQIQQKLLTQHIAILPDSDTVWHKLFVSHVESLIHHHGLSKYAPETYRLARQYGLENLQQWREQGVITQAEYDQLRTLYQDKCDQCVLHCEGVLKTREQMRARPEEAKLSKRERIDRILQRVRVEASKLSGEAPDEQLKDAELRHAQLMSAIRQEATIRSIGRLDPKVEPDSTPVKRSVQLEMMDAQTDMLHENSSVARSETFTGSHGSPANKTHRSSFSKWVSALVRAPHYDHETELGLNQNQPSTFAHINASSCQSEMPQSQMLLRTPSAFISQVPRSHSSDQDDSQRSMGAPGHDMDQDISAGVYGLKPLVPPFLSELNFALERRLLQQSQPVALRQYPADDALTVYQYGWTAKQCAVDASDKRSPSQNVRANDHKALVLSPPQSGPDVCPKPEQTPHGVLVPIQTAKKNGIFYRVFSLWANVNQLLQPKHSLRLPLIQNPASALSLDVVSSFKPLPAMQIAPELALSPYVYNQTHNAFKSKPKPGMLRPDSHNGSANALKDYSMFSKRLRPHLGLRRGGKSRMNDHEFSNRSVRT